MPPVESQLDRRECEPVSFGTVMIVPGIGGSTLYTPPALFGLFQPLKLWLNVLALPGGGWRLLGLSADGVTPDVPLTGQLVPGLALVEYYSTLSDQLRRRGWRVVDARLDWRQQIVRDAQRLADQVIELRHNGPVHLLCHSRGGLVARRAFTLLAQVQALHLVGRCAGLGVPHEGSWEAAGLLAGWNQGVYLLSLLLDSPVSWLGSASVLGSIHDVVITWPGAYELLPSPAAPGVPPDVLARVYVPAGWTAIGQPVSAPWLAAAYQHWITLPAVPTPVEWIDVVGVGLDTAIGLRTVLPPPTSQELTWGADGDGTVPAIWATQPGRRRITTPTSHRGLVYDGRVIAALDSYLRHGLVEDVVIGGRVLV